MKNKQPKKKKLQVRNNNENKREITQVKVIKAKQRKKAPKIKFKIDPSHKKINHTYMKDEMPK